MHRLLTSLRRFAAFLRLISAASLPDWRSPSLPARRGPLIPRGHLLMCPQRAASLFIFNSSRRFTPSAYALSHPIAAERDSRQAYPPLYRTVLRPAHQVTSDVFSFA